jgi:hypothetical protein
MRTAMKGKKNHCIELVLDAHESIHIGSLIMLLIILSAFFAEIVMIGPKG